jgi:hypothetical protein
MTLSVVAMALASSGDMGTIATEACGVIGSVLGAFFGVHAGLGDRERVDNERRDERERVDNERRDETKKVEMLAAMMPEDKRDAALDLLTQ